MNRSAVEFPTGRVFKWARLGYDGKGVFLVQPGDTRSGALESFFREAANRGVPIFCEERVEFKRELAMVAALSTQGEFKHWPLVVSDQSGGICRKVLGPATALGISQAAETYAREACEKLARAVGLVGVFAVEFFETATGELSVNEIAPRVHNTGHYTQDASRTSQFENHWRAVLGLPLGETTTSAGFVMINLIGPPGPARLVSRETIAKPGAEGVLHWYKKKEIRTGRKMGHLNGRVEQVSELPALVKALEQQRLKWESRLK
jgi:5-(carboxyamino)imidazole ribonucleotide synthase